MDFGEDFGLLEWIVILGLIGAIGYGIYKIVQSLGTGPGSPLGPAGTPDPGGGNPSSGYLSTALNATLEIGQSSESYTDALVQSVSSPIQTLASIFGFNQSAAASDGTENY